MHACAQIYAINFEFNMCASGQTVTRTTCTTKGTSLIDNPISVSKSIMSLDLQTMSQYNIHYTQDKIHQRLMSPLDNPDDIMHRPNACYS